MRICALLVFSGRRSLRCWASMLEDFLLEGFLLEGFIFCLRELMLLEKDEKLAAL